MQVSMREFGVSLVVAVVYLAFTVGTHWPSLASHLMWDDWWLIGSFYFTTPWEGIQKCLTPGAINGAFWRPLNTLSFFFDFSLWAFWSPGYHITNLLLHWGCALLMRSLLLALGCKQWESIALTLPVLWHPTPTAAVTWIAGRSDLISAFFVFAFLRMLLAYQQEGGRIRWILCAVSAMFALVSKESAFTLPAMTLYLLWHGEKDRLPGQRLLWGTIVVELGGLLLLRSLTLGSSLGGFLSYGGQKSLNHLVPSLESMVFLPADLLFGFSSPPLWLRVVALVPVYLLLPRGVRWSPSLFFWTVFSPITWLIFYNPTNLRYTYLTAWLMVPLVLMGLPRKTWLIVAVSVGIGVSYLPRHRTGQKTMAKASAAFEDVITAMVSVHNRGELRPLLLINQHLQWMDSRSGMYLAPFHNCIYYAVHLAQDQHIPFAEVAVFDQFEGPEPSSYYPEFATETTEKFFLVTNPRHPHARESVIDLVPLDRAFLGKDSRTYHLVQPDEVFAVLIGFWVAHPDLPIDLQDFDPSALEITMVLEDRDGQRTSWIAGSDSTRLVDRRILPATEVWGKPLPTRVGYYLEGFWPLQAPPETLSTLEVLADLPPGALLELEMVRFHHRRKERGILGAAQE